MSLMSKADLPDMIKFFKKVGVATKEYKKTLERQQAHEPDYLKGLFLLEQQMALEDEKPLDEEEIANIMKAHKANSPFALNVEVSRAKLFKVMNQ